MQVTTSDNGRTKQRYLFSVILAGREYSKSISSGNSSNVVYKFISAFHNVMAHF